MEILKILSNNSLIVTILGILLTTFLSVVGYFIKKIIDINKKEKDLERVNQNNIIQNFNTGINYSDVEKIAENVAENVFERKILKMKKQ